MYTRCPSIANVFQKAALLKDTKCNKMIQRHLRSESLVSFPKIEKKLKPMKRCFSGASNNKNFMHKSRNIQGAGIMRRSLSKKTFFISAFPREMVQRRPSASQTFSLRQSMPLSQLPNNQEIVGNPVECQSINDDGNTQITIVIDKKDICSSPNEDVKIHVTTNPDLTSKRITEAFTKNEPVQNRSTKCNCCQRCGETKQLTLPMEQNAFQQPKNDVNLSNQFPRLPQNVYGIPLRNLSALDGGRSPRMEMLTLKKNRSMSDFRTMRKMLVPNVFDQIQMNMGQLPMTMMRSPTVSGARSQSKLNTLASFNNNQPQTLQRANIPPLQRSFSSQSLQNANTNEIHLPKQRTRKLGTLFRSQNVTKNNIPNVERSKQQRNENQTEIGRNLPKIDQPYQPPEQLTVPVMRPAMFSSTDGTNNNNISVANSLQKVKSAALSQKQKASKLFMGPFVRDPNLFYVHEATTKNKFPKERTSVPRMLTFQSQNTLNNSQRKYADNISKKISQVGLRSPLIAPTPIQTASKTNMFTKNNATRLVDILPKQKSATSTSHGNSLIQHFLVQRQSPSVPKKKAELRPASNQNHQIKRRSPSDSKNISLQRTYLSHLKQPAVSQIGTFGRSSNLVKPQKMTGKNRFPEGRESLRKMLTIQSQNLVNRLQRSYEDEFSKRISPNLKCDKKSCNMLHTKQRNPALMPTGRPINLYASKKPPQVFLKKRSVRPAKKHPQIKRKPVQIRRSSSIRVPQKRSLPQRNAATKQYSAHKKRLTKPLQTSMIPVRQMLPRSDLLKNRSDSFRKNPVMPFNEIGFSSQSKGTRPISANDQRNRSDVRRMNQQKLQSSLPVAVTTQPNQIQKYVERPKSMQNVKRPYSIPVLVAPLRLNETIQRPTLVKDLRVPDNALQVRPTALMDPRKNVLQKQQIQPNNLKATTPTSSQIPNVDKSITKSENPGVLFYAPGKIKLVNLPVPRLADEKGVIVKMLYVHLTDTDSLMLSSTNDGPYKLTQPTIAGKSGSGLIVDAGKQVENVKIGDKVSVKGLSCGECAACENDNEVICERISVIEKLGILKRFHAVPSKFVTKLPDTVHPIDGAMVDELSSAIRACKKATVTAGDSVLVIGGKSLGLWTALAAKSMGATNVCLADSRNSVLEQAKKLGIDRAFLINPDLPVSKTSQIISDYMDGENPRIVFDCNGSSLTNEIAIKISLIGGKVVLMKNSIPNQPIGLSGAVERGIDILASQHGNNDSERAALQFLASGKVQLSGIDSTFFDISNVHEAFGLLNSGTISNIFVQPSRLDDENNGKQKSKTQ